MKKTLLVISILLFLNSSTELHQLFKVPFLLQHYYDHLRENSSISLLEFLKIHYTGNHPIDNDDQEDGRLPFKDATNVNHTDSPLMVLRELPGQPVAYIDPGPGILLYENIPSPRKDSIFHPPQDC